MEAAGATDAASARTHAHKRTRTHTHTATDDLGPIGSISSASHRCVKAHCGAIARPQPKTSYCLLLSKTGVQISVGLFHGHRKRFNNNMSSILLRRKFNFQFNFTLISACIKVNHLEEMERCISPLRARTCAGSPRTRGGGLSLEIPIRNSNRDGSSNIRKMSDGYRFQGSQVH